MSTDYWNRRCVRHVYSKFTLLPVTLSSGKKVWFRRYFVVTEGLPVDFSYDSDVFSAATREEAESVKSQLDEGSKKKRAELQSRFEDLIAAGAKDAAARKEARARAHVSHVNRFSNSSASSSTSDSVLSPGTALVVASVYDSSSNDSSSSSCDSGSSDSGSSGCGGDSSD